MRILSMRSFRVNPLKYKGEPRIFIKRSKHLKFKKFTKWITRPHSKQIHENLSVQLTFLCLNISNFIHHKKDFQQFSKHKKKVLHILCATVNLCCLHICVNTNKYQNFFHIYVKKKPFSNSKMCLEFNPYWTHKKFSSLKWIFLSARQLLCIHTLEM